ncbi:MAG: cytochrome c oxidase subunit 3 [Gammaproteobacteria bacterium]|nr:cytochrome c oxidase subunit 3 [Gammaproteobacteria bacterium]
MSLLRKLTEKPWTTTGQLEELPDPYVIAANTKRTALFVFLGVVSSLFFLFVMAQHQREALPDWQPITALPSILGLNTLLLIGASLAMQYAKAAADGGNLAGLKRGFVAAGLLTAAFLVGQVIGWQQMTATGQVIQVNPANAFFFLLTGAHGLHLVGGLYVWARNSVRVLRGFGQDDADQARELRLSVELCTTYWHYLLLIWLVLLGLLLVT